MKIIVGTFVFLLVLFLYIHIYFHIKTSNDLELFQFSNMPSKEKLEEICDLRQPTVFNYPNERLLGDCTQKHISDIYGAFDIKIRDKKQQTENSELFVPLNFKTSIELFKKDSASRFISENNYDFLDETSLIKTYQYNDEFIRPYMVAECDYDFVFGSHGATTSLRFELNYRNYLYVTEGSLKVKLAPPKSKKYLYVNYDYDNFEFSSPINPWDPQPNYRADFDKIKFLEIDITAGQMLFIPAYWWYSIKFDNQTKDTSICFFKYKTFMNFVSIIPHLFKQLLQRQNIKHDTIRKYIQPNTVNLQTIVTPKQPTVNTQDFNTVEEPNTITNTGNLSQIPDSMPTNTRFSFSENVNNTTPPSENNLLL